MCPFPACKSGVTLFYRHHGLSPGATEGDDRGKRVNNIRIFSSPPLPAPCLLAAPGDDLLSSGCRQGGHMPSPLPSTSLPPLVTALQDCGALPCPQDGMAVWGLRPPGMTSPVPPTSRQGHTARPKNRDTPFLALSLGAGCSFGGTKSGMGVILGKPSSFPGCN